MMKLFLALDWGGGFRSRFLGNEYDDDDDDDDGKWL